MDDDHKELLRSISSMLSGLQTTLTSAAISGAITANRADMLRREAKALYGKTVELVASVAEKAKP